MTEGSQLSRSGQWRSLDGSADPASFVDYLDRAAANLRGARLEVIRRLDVQPGCSVLDVGCGAGEFLIEAASSVKGVHAVGIDVSEVMVNTATSRARAAGVPVQFILGDAHRLDFADERFDRVNCSRVLLHLEDPRVAVAEMARVLAPGGRVAIFEPDFDAFMIDSDDLNIAGAVRHQLTAALRNPDIGRRLRRLLLDTGLNVLEVSGSALPVASLQVAVEQFDLLDHLDSAVAAGEVGAEAANQWRGWIEKADASHRLFVSPVAFRAIATKPGH